MHNSKMILGVMSGSSLDGLDLALCRFSGIGEKLEWEILRTECIPFSSNWKERLVNLPKASAIELSQADYDFGNLLGAACKAFLAKQKVDYIASHGHTIFHFPEQKSTRQIGNGAAIAVSSGHPVICDFRSTDIALGGQGAPIVSVFDQLVFGHIEMMANLGGIVNITFNQAGETMAFDIGPCNQLLNYLARKEGLDFDEDGILASRGEIIEDLLEEMLSAPYFSLPIPKSLDNSDVANTFFSILDKHDGSLEDKLRTATALIALTMKDCVLESPYMAKNSTPKLLLAGGGANNPFLVQQINYHIPEVDVIVPDKQFIDYKEALMMAFLGYLRIHQENNVFSSVTGAVRDSIGGAIYLA